MGSTANDSARFDLLPAGAGNELETVDDRRTSAVHFSGLFSVSRPWTALTAKQPWLGMIVVKPTVSQFEAQAGRARSGAPDHFGSGCIKVALRAGAIRRIPTQTAKLNFPCKQIRLLGFLPNAAYNRPPLRKLTTCAGPA